MLRFRVSVLVQVAFVLTMVGLSQSAMAVPGAPTIISPTRGMVMGSNRPDITFQGDPSDAYQVHIGSNNVPASIDGWDSGTVSVTSSSDPVSVVSGDLNASANYYVFVRLHNSSGWGPWSAPGNYFYTSAQLINEALFVVGPDGAQRDEDMCYNPDDHEYLLAYFDARVSWEVPKVSYVILDSTGSIKAGTSERTIEEPTSGARGPSVCYNSVLHEYMLVYPGWLGGGASLHDEVWALRISPGGAPKGSPQRICETGWMWGQDLTYAPPPSGTSETGTYLLAWWNRGGGGGWPGDAKVHSRLLRADGASSVIVGPEVNLTPGIGSDCLEPIITSRPAGNEFHVAYTALLSSHDIYGVRVSAATGQPTGSSIPLVQNPTEDGQADVAYSPELDKYLLVYTSHYDGSCVWGQFLSSSGALEGSAFSINTEAPTSGGDVRVAWQPNQHEFLATWMDGGSYRNYGRRISSTGALIGERFDLVGHASAIGIGNWAPFPVANTTNDEFLICWFNSYTDIYTRRYRPSPIPASDVTPPGPVTGVSATAGDQQVTLSWTNPSDSDFAGTMIRYSVSSYPSGPNDGQLLVDATNVPGSTDSFTHTNLNGGTAYYYSLFAYDEKPNYSAFVHVMCTPNGPRVMATSAFNSTADGWSTSVWKSGGLDPGTIGWSSSAGSSGGGMRCTGSGATDNNTRDTREGAEMWKTITTAHFQGIRVSYDLRLSSLGSAYYGVGSGSTGIPVDHNDVREQLTVFYSTDAGANWTEVSPWLGRDTLLGYLSYGNRQIDLSSIPAVSNNTSFALKFRWQFNTATDIGDLDNIVISGSQMETVQPTIALTSPTSAAHCPSNITPFTVSGTASDNVGVTAVTWSNNRGGSGTCSLSVPGDRSVYWDGAATLQSGQNLLTFRAYDAAGNVRSTTLMVAYSPGAPLVIGDAKKLADNALAYLSGKTVTTVLSDNSFYVEEPGQSAGIRVKPYSVLSSVVVGKRVDCSGALKTETNGERYLSGSALVTGDAAVLSPVGVTGRSLGGSSWFYNSGTGAGQRGIQGAVGLNNIGMLVAVWGKVTQRDTAGSQYFYIDDGSAVSDGTLTAGVTNVGVRVLANPTTYSTDTYVCVTGVCSCFKDSGGLLRWQIVPTSGGIQIVAP